MYDVYRDIIIRDLKVGSISLRASSFLYFVVGDHHQRVLGNEGLQLFLRALNAQASGAALRQFPCSLLSLAPASPDKPAVGH
jgi:hypothetical protein